jgi:hypothetical protein
MVDTSVVNNGDQPAPYPPHALPDVIKMSAAEMSRVPAPGTLRRLKAETGKSFDDLVGQEADAADRFQTFIWIKLRRSIEGLRWQDCAEIEIDVQDGVDAVMDPTKLAVSAVSPPSADSGD